jgi:glycosyltransferase involved in cell wall biosynthesis
VELAVHGRHRAHLAARSIRILRLDFVHARLLSIRRTDKPAGEGGETMSSPPESDVLGDDVGREVLIEPLLDRLQPSARLEYSVDDGPDELAAGLERARTLDLLWLRGSPTWHSLRALAPVIAKDAVGRPEGPPVVLVEAGPPSAALPERAERAKDGVRLGLVALGEQLDGRGVVTWWAPGRGLGAFVPSTRLPAVADWLAERRPLIDVVNALHERGIDLDDRSMSLFELLDQSQHNALELVRSLRFRVGTRIVRLGRRVLRKERIFRAPVEIIARNAKVQEWRARFAAERAPREDDTVGRDALSVTYIVPELRLSGGVLVVLELANELRRAGVDARVVALKDRRREMFRWRLAVRPKLYPSAEQLAQNLAVTDIVVATHWRTAACARAAVDAGRARRAAYFLQDFEPWFHTEADRRGRARVTETYALIPDRIVTSEWLRALLADEGYDAQKIALGVDLGFFYPRPPVSGAHPVVLAMARPRTPRRGFETLVGALARVHEARPDAEIVLFGEELGGLDLPFPYRAEGVIGDPQRLAEQYASARVFVDVSDFQAFGLPVLEAMACGTVSVVTRVGGVHEYARHGENCLLVPPKDVDAAASAVVALLSDDELHRRLRDGALATSADHSMRQVALQTRAAFEEIRASSLAP